MKLYYPGADILKYIMAFAVIAIHAGAITHFEEMPFGVEWFIRLAVPYFFVASGVFLGRKLDNLSTDKEKCRQLQSRVIQMFERWIKWVAIYLPLALWAYYEQGMPAPKAVVHYFAMLVSQGWSFYGWALWFIYSVALSLLLISFIYKSGRYEKLVACVLIVFFLGQEISGWWRTVHYVPGKLLGYALDAYHSFAGGLPILIGIALGRRLGRITLSQKILGGMALICVSVVLNIIALPFWELTGSVALLLLCTLQSQTAPMAYASFLRKESMWIYFIHMYFVFIAAKLLGMTDVLHVFLFASVASAFMAALLWKLEGIKWFGWLSKLIF